MILFINEQVGVPQGALSVSSTPYRTMTVRCNHYEIGVTLMVMKPAPESVEGNSENFVKMMQRLIRVPHAEVKAKLDAERAAKRPSKRVSRASGAASKAR
jgi:hypothetical protein